jgi:DNA-binding response OmpR family regulator
MDMTKILYVEDESDLREDVIEELEEDGYDVAWAPNGAEGLRMLAAFKADLVISDCLMPVMTGIEMLAQVRASDSPFRSTPFIFLSAHADRAHVEQGLGVGADGYVTKPVDYSTLVEKIEALCQREPDALLRTLRDGRRDVVGCRKK